MEDIKIQYLTVCKKENLILLQKFNLKKKIVSETSFGVFSILIEMEEKPLRIELKPHKTKITFNCELNNKIFLLLDNELKIEEIFHVVRTKINKTENADVMFLVYNRIKIKPTDFRKIKCK